METLAPACLISEQRLDQFRGNDNLSWLQCRCMYILRSFLAAHVSHSVSHN